jgi:dTDP-4-dehydrorhamnose reductase
MKRLLITGASGFLGSNACIFASQQWDVFGVTHSRATDIPGTTLINTDLTDFNALKHLFHEVSPDAVLHTAAASKLNFCQTNPKDSRRINVQASINIAGLCADRDIPLTFTSTDNVFDGRHPPYRETTPVSPINIYGEQKVQAETEMIRIYPKTAICRLALMFGITLAGVPSGFQQFLTALRAGEQQSLFTDEYRSFISASTVCSGLMLALNDFSGILHLGGNETMSRYDFGLLMAEIFQINKAQLIPSRIKDVPMAAPRAPNLSMDNSKARKLGLAPLPLKQELEKLRRTSETIELRRATLNQQSD